MRQAKAQSTKTGLAASRFANTSAEDDDATVAAEENAAEEGEHHEVDHSSTALASVRAPLA